MEKFKGFFNNPNAMDRMGAIGLALSGLDQGRVADLSGYANSIRQRRESAPIGQVGGAEYGLGMQELEAQGLLDGFTPQQRAMLAQMPRNEAMRLIRERAFTQPDPSQQFVSQMMTGDVMSRFTPEQRAALAAMPPTAAQQLLMDTIFAKPADPMRQIELEKARLELAQLQNPERKIITGADGYQYYQDTQERVLPSVLLPEKPGYVQLTPEQVQLRGLDSTKQWQESPDGRVTQIGGGGTNISVNTGPTASTVGQEAVDKKYAEDFIAWSQGGAADMASQLAQLNSGVGELESGANLTGPVVGSLPNGLAAITNPQAAAMRERVEEVVQRNLRIVLGAQFTEKEGDRLISRAYNPRLPEAENAARLRRLTATMQGAFEARNAQADYFREHGTLAGYEGPRVSISTFSDALEGRTEFPDASKMSATEIADFMRVNPSEGWTPEQREAILARLRELREGN